MEGHTDERTERTNCVKEKEKEAKESKRAHTLMHIDILNIYICTRGGIMKFIIPSSTP